MRIAICDDNEKDRAQMAAALADYLKRRGLVAEVTTFDHPDRLLQSLRRMDFDIYMLDILMPMVDGIAVTRELRALKGRVPVVFFSTSREYALKAFGVKAVDYVLKPWTATAFAEAMDAALQAVPHEESVLWTVKTLTGLRRIRPERITHVMTHESVRHVLVLHLEDGETLLMRGSVVGLHQELTAYLRLVAVGKSLLVNPAYIAALDGTRVTLARTVGGVVTLEVPKSAISSLRAGILAL